VSAVAAAILTVDDSVLDVDKLVSLRGVAPSDEELTVLKAYTGDVKALGEIEQVPQCKLNIIFVTEFQRCWITACCCV
jgi:hypothetical protein